MLFGCLHSWREGAYNRRKQPWGGTSFLISMACERGQRPSNGRFWEREKHNNSLIVSRNVVIKE
jgi:hypothetical protein